jgi:glycosyltransferase involved in cell wall biosynthesis
MSRRSLPSVSVVVPVYNGERTLRDCLEAIFKQQYPTELFEVIVVDNNSSDSTPRIAASYPKVKYLKQMHVQNSYATRNLGCAQAQGEIVAFTDSDCLPDVDWLANLAAPFQSKSVLAVGGAVLDAEAKNLVEQFLAEINPLGKYHEAHNQFLHPLITANVGIRKSVFEELGMFNANLYTGADIDFAWRLQLKYGDCVCYALEAIIYHRHRSNLQSMFRQYRRHGFGEIFLDAIYQRYPGYPRTLRYQVTQMSRQIWALLKVIRAFIYRSVKYPFKRDRYYMMQPVFWFVVESGSLWGKIQGLWTTRGLRLNPELHQWQDPGG